MNELFLSLNRPFWEQVHWYHQFGIQKAVDIGSSVTPVLGETTLSQETSHLGEGLPFTPAAKRTKRSDSIPSEVQQQQQKGPHVSPCPKKENWQEDQQDSSSPRSWGFILKDLADLAPFMTPWEYEWTCFLASIGLLSYLIPNCAHIPLLAPHLGPESSSTHTENSERILLLEEIFEYVTRPYLATVSTDEDKEITSQPPLLAPLDDLFYASFLHFLYDGLGPWLQSRTLFSSYEAGHVNQGDTTYSEETTTKGSPPDPGLALFHDYPHKHGVDSGSTSLLLVLAIAILSNQTPCMEGSVSDPQDSSSLFSTRHFSNKFIDTFLTSWITLQWNIPYIMRVETVYIISKYLHLSLVTKDSMNSRNTLLVDDPKDQTPVGQDIQFRSENLSFLRLALKSFDMHCLSIIHSQYSKQALINMALHTWTHSWVDDSFTSIFHTLLQGPTECKTTNSCSCTETWIKLGFHRWNERFSYIKDRILGCTSPLDNPFESYRDGQDRARDNVQNKFKQSFLSSYTFVRSQSHQQKYYSQMDHWKIVDNNHSSCVTYLCVTLLEDLIIRYNRSRLHPEHEFNLRAFCKGISALHALLQPWNGVTKILSTDRQDRFEKDDHRPSCQIAALIKILSTLLYIMIHSPVLDLSTSPSITNHHGIYSSPSCNGSSSIESLNDAIADGVMMTTQLLHHPETIVISSATNFLHVFLLRSKNDDAICRIQQAILPLMFHSLKDSDPSYLVHDRKNKYHHILENLMLWSVSHSEEFSRQVLSFLMKALDDHENYSENSLVILFRVLSHLSSKRPALVLDQASRIGGLKIDRCLEDRLMVLLTLRIASIDHDLGCMLDGAIHTISPSISPVSLYELATAAICVGRFTWASQVFKNLADTLCSTTAYMWMRALHICTEAETVASENEMDRFPEAISKIDQAIELLKSLSLIRQNFLDRPLNYVLPFSFQISFLSIRRDLLNSLALLKQSFQGTSKNEDVGEQFIIRARIISQSFMKLATRVFMLNRLLGIFICKQSRASLWSLFILCRYLSVATKKRGDMDSTKIDHFSIWPQGVIFFQMSQLIAECKEKLDENKASIPLPSLIRFTESLIRVSTPFPRSFFSTRVVPLAYLRITSSPSTTTTENCATCSHPFVEILHIPIGTSFCIYVDGIFSNEYMKHATLYFSQVALWYSIKFDGFKPSMMCDRCFSPYSYIADCTTMTSDKMNENDFVTLRPGMFYNCVSSDEIYGSKFSKWLECKPLTTAGFHTICVHVGIRDVQFGEYEAMSHPQTNRIIVHASSKDNVVYSNM